MKKIQTLVALCAVFAMMFSTVAMAAPSPVAGTVTVTIPGSGGSSAAQIKVPSEQDIKALGDFISANAAASGMTANVKGTIEIVAPANYQGGDVPVVFAAAGLPNGATNVFAYIIGPKGKIIIIPCTVRNGYIGFIAPVLGPVAIVQLTPAAQSAANATNPAATAAVPATLH